MEIPKEKQVEIQATNILHTTEKQTNKCHKIYVQTLRYTLKAQLWESYSEVIYS